MWHKLIQTFVDNPVSKSSPCIVRVERQHIMLKLKIMTTALAVASLILLLTGSTYFTAALSVICTATTLLPAGYLMWRWLLDEKPSWFHSITWAALSGLIAARALKDIGIIDIPLGTVMSPEKVAELGSFASFMSILPIFLAVVVPSSPTRNNNDED